MGDCEGSIAVEAVLHLPLPPPSCGAHPHNLQVEVLRREVGRLTAETNRLHGDLLAEAEARAAAEAATRQQSQRAEARAADAEFAKQQALQRGAELERERDGLRARVHDLLAFGGPQQQQQRQGEAELQAAALQPRMSLSRPLEPKPSPAAAARTSQGALSLIKAADGRIQALEEELRRRDGELQGLAGQLQAAQVGCMPGGGGGGGGEGGGRGCIA